jgi:hypothetical protein
VMVFPAHTRARRLCVTPPAPNVANAP